MKDSIREKLNRIATRVQVLVRERNSYREQVFSLTERLAQESAEKADALVAKAEALGLASKALENDAEQELQLAQARKDAEEAQAASSTLNQEKFALLAQLEALKASEEKEDAAMEKELGEIDQSASEPDGANN
jgi:hypothetical protein